MCQINIKNYNQICAVLLDDGKMLMNACDKHILVTANLTQCHIHFHISLNINNKTCI